MSEFVRTPNHSYSAALRFFGDSLNPSEITRRLCLQPSHSSNGLSVSPSGRRGCPFWGYNGEGEDGYQSEWQSLEQGLEFLLQRLASHRATVIELSRHFEGIWWCEHFQASFAGGPKLSSEVLADIASYRLPLFIDNHIVEEA